MNAAQLLALEQFFRKEYESLCRYVYCIVSSSDDTVEIVQEAFLRYCEIHLQRPSKGKERSLLFRLARNLAIDSVRRRKVRVIRRRRVEEAAAASTPAADPEQLLLAKEQRQLAQSALERLNENQKDCLLLRAAGLSYKDIAGILQLSTESIGPTLARALEKVKTAYEELVEKEASRGAIGGVRRR